MNTHPIPEQTQKKLAAFYYNRPVLVTGGCGFIGSHLTQELVALGAYVTVLDNLQTGSIENIAAFKHKVPFLQETIEDEAVCTQATRDQRVIFHLAALVSVPQSVAQPMACYQTNVTGTLKLLEAARTANCNRFVFSSSCSVYGEHPGECHEQVRPDPASPYALSKYVGEQYCQQYTHIYGLPTVSLRYFNVFGERQNPHAAYAAAYATFSHQMEHNLPITIFGDGTQTRDFVPVQEVVQANLIAGMAEQQTVAGQIFNVASGKTISIAQLAEKLQKKFPAYTGDIAYAPARPGDVKHVNGSCKKLRTLYDQV